MRPFLEIVTRHLATRPTLLADNQASLARLGDDWTQTLLIDRVGRGVEWANGEMAGYGRWLRGEWIWILDDDDICIRPNLVSELQQLVGRSDADVIVMRMDHGPLGILPDNQVWMTTPTRGRIGCSAVVVRRRLWQMCAHAYTARYDADYDFISAVFSKAAGVIWHDVIASRVQCIGQGRSEESILAMGVMV
jgi:hypothetical protein